MASENELEQPPETPQDDDGSAAGKGAEDPTRQAPVNGTAQPTSPSLEPEPPRAALFGDDEAADDNASTASIPSDAASEQVTSPSASIPPYWSSSRAEEQRQLQQQNQLRPHPSGHTRVVSSASAESVLPPGAITLQDNEREDDDDINNNGTEPTGRRSNSSELYGRDRNRACWARSVQVTDYVLVNGSTTNIGAFVVWHIRVETLNVCFSLCSLLTVKRKWESRTDMLRAPA
jgi:hypothetical protein